MLKHYYKKQIIYAIKLNSIDKFDSKNEPKWLFDYDNIFPKELSQLPPKRKSGHAIDLITRAQPITKRPYKMFAPEAIELKEQLKQLLEQGFIWPNVSP